MTGRNAILALAIVLTVPCAAAGIQPSVKPIGDDPSRLRALAGEEIRQSGKVKASSTDAAVSGAMLSLQDPLPAIRNRSWDYYLSLSVQSYQPSGRGANDLAEARFDLGETSATVMPSLALGVQRPIYSRLSGALGGRVSYSSQKGSGRFPNGYIEPDVRLNTSLISAQPSLQYRFLRWPWLRTSISGEIGSLHYTQSSGNKKAAFSEHGSFVGTGVALGVRLSPHTELFAEYLNRRLREADTNIGIQTDNYQLGTRITW